MHGMFGWLAAAVVGVSVMAACDSRRETGLPAGREVRLMTLDPGHFHAALVQKEPLAGVNRVADVYAPEGSDLREHLDRITGFNSRVVNPTGWEQRLHIGPDFLERMLAERPGNVVVISGNNARKTRYIEQCVDAGLHVLADKPMAITPDDFTRLREALARAQERGVLVYDIMTERYEIATMLQRDLSRMPEVFGQLEKGTADVPAVTKESVHHFSKMVAGRPLKRPAWFFDTAQQGEGIVDVTTHLVDLIQWECFPEEVLDWRRDVQVDAARRWATKLTLDEFAKVTGLKALPAELRKDVAADGALAIYANGQIDYRLRGIHARVSVTWNFEAPPGGGDTHFSIMRGTRADLVVQQTAAENFKPTLYIKNKAGTPPVEFEKTLRHAVEQLSRRWPGLTLAASVGGWRVVVPDKYVVGHEAHFAQVTENFLGYLARGRLPEWEVPNMLAKYYTTTCAWEMSR